MATVAAWYALGAQALDQVLALSGAAAAPAVIQLWPEHFDLAVDVAAGTTRVNLGVSPGDGFSAAPYLYVGPWLEGRPGDPAFWNAPFGGFATIDAVSDVDAAVAFLERGLALLVDV